MKKILCVLLSAMMLVLCGCSSSAPADEKLSLIGTWTQTNSESPDSYQEAVITENSMEIYWVSDGGETKALYWAGTYSEPTTNDKEYVWTSQNDTEKTSVALLASGDETKEFTYKDGVISYSTSALGVTTTVKLEKK